jgi:hypothetical protein
MEGFLNSVIIIKNMRIIRINISGLIPIDYGFKSRKEIDKKRATIFIEKPKIIGIESLVYSGKMYVADGHHTGLAYLEENISPQICILENDDDLRLYQNCGSINTSHFYTMRERLHKWHLEALKKGVNTFYDLKKLIKE